MSVWCGGKKPLHNSINQGRCGICGDEFSAPNKEYEAGGLYATGTIAKSYLPGQEITVKIDMTMNHRGFFTFALCAHNNPETAPGRECFLNNQLMVNNGARVYATAGNGIKEMKVQLPPGLTCKQCIFQMTYTNGNDWGSGPQSMEVQTEDCLLTKGKKGCGPQETFRGCSDICIGSFCPQEQCAKVGDIKGVGDTMTPAPVTITSITPQTDTCLSAGIKKLFYSQQGDQYCKSVCLGKTVTECYQTANAKFICFCSQGAGRTLELSYPAVLLPAVNYSDIEFP